MLANRQQAGLLLAKRVIARLQEYADYKSLESVVVALPRGGVPVALEIAKANGCPLDVLVSKKIGAPYQPELAIGAVSSSGVVVLNEDLAAVCGADRDYVQKNTQALVEKTKRLEEYWQKSSGIKSRPELNGKTVILVDDGIATGMTVLCALRTLKTKSCKRVILVSPVMSQEAYQLLRTECDEVITLAIPYNFRSVGAHYYDFHQVEDAEVIQDLVEAHRAYSCRFAGKAEGN